MSSGRDPAERLTPADASNVVLDAPDQVNTFLLAGTLGPGGCVGPDGTTDMEMLREAIASRIRDDQGILPREGLRRFSQRVRRAGRKLVWEPCPPDLARHVRRVDPVSGRTGLAALCATLMTTPLPQDRPLWELLVVPGASPHGPGIVLRVHHAVADGVAGVRLAVRLFDPPAGSESTPPAPAAPPAPARPGPDGGRRRRAGTGVARLAAMVRRTVPRTVLLGPIGAHRGVAFADVDLARFADGSRASGGTVNDALLGAVAAVASAALGAAGEPVPMTLPASVPVALPDRGVSGNAVGVMLVPLPLREPDPALRVATIARLTAAAKQEARAQGTYELTRTRAGSRLFALLARRQHFVAVFVTNVRGPEQLLRLAGAPLERAWPVAPIQGNVRLGVAAFSYAGRLGCAAHLDADALDLDVIGRALAEELTRIAAA